MRRPPLPAIADLLSMLTPEELARLSSAARGADGTS